MSNESPPAATRPADRAGAAGPAPSTALHASADASRSAAAAIARLGPRGLRARARLLAAARTVLDRDGPLALTAIAIARQAGVAPATFYVYFASLGECLLALAEEAGADHLAIARPLGDEPWPPADMAGWAAGWFECFRAQARSHGRVIAVRNAAANAGDAAFHRSRVDAFEPVAELLADRIRDARPGQDPMSCLAAAVALHQFLAETALLIESPTMERRLGDAVAEAAIRFAVEQLTPADPASGAAADTGSSAASGTAGRANSGRRR